jgi:hypothetical protein
MSRIMIDLELQEREALITLAQRERRDPRDQAALFVVDGLRREGLLSTDPLAAVDEGLNPEAGTHVKSYR